MKEFLNDIQTDRSIKLRYIRDKHRHPRGLVIVDSETGETGWSYCCKQDTFKKSTAREIAMARLCGGSSVTPPRPVQAELIEVQEWIARRRTARA